MTSFGQLHDAAKRRLLRFRPYVFDLIAVLARAESLERRQVFHLIRRRVEHAQRPVLPSLNETVTEAFLHHCVDSDVFRRRGAPPEEGLFCWPQGKSAGIWGLKRENAAAMLRASRQQLRGAADAGDDRSNGPGAPCP
jgi:hypothetical protein